MMYRFDWLIRWFSVLLTGLLFTMTLNTDSLAPAAYLVINQGLFITISCFLLLPAAGNTASLFANGVAGIPLLIFLSQLAPVGVVPLQLLLHTSLMVLCLSFFLWSSSQLFSAVFSDEHHRRKPVLLFTVFIISAPVWLGPLVDIYQPGDTIINTIISITPLTHFSVAVDYDYLRSEWFYRNTPFGSLPFSYPGLVSIITGYLMLVFSMQIVRWWLTQHNVTLVPIQQQKHSLKLS